jgi:hypothetical protein
MNGIKSSASGLEAVFFMVDFDLKQEDPNLGA